MNAEAMLKMLLGTIFPPEAAEMVQEYLNPENIEKMKRDIQETKQIVDAVPGQLVDIIDTLDEIKDRLDALEKNNGDG